MFSKQELVAWSQFKMFAPSKHPDDVKIPSTKTSARICPMLKLHTGCPLMVTENTEVRGGVANGTQATFKGITKQKEVLKLAAMMLLG
jgi:hypothetical protein